MSRMPLSWSSTCRALWPRANHQCAGAWGEGVAKSYCMLMTGGRVSPRGGAAAGGDGAGRRTGSSWRSWTFAAGAGGVLRHPASRLAGLSGRRPGPRPELLELAKQEAPPLWPAVVRRPRRPSAPCGRPAEEGLAAALWPGGGRMILGTGIDMIEIERIAHPSTLWDALPGARLRRGDRLLPAQTA